MGGSLLGYAGSVFSVDVRASDLAGGAGGRSAVTPVGVTVVARGRQVMVELGAPEGAVTAKLMHIQRWGLIFSLHLYSVEQ